MLFFLTLYSPCELPLYFVNGLFGWHSVSVCVCYLIGVTNVGIPRNVESVNINLGDSNGHVQPRFVSGFSSPNHGITCSI